MDLRETAAKAAAAEQHAAGQMLLQRQQQIMVDDANRLIELVEQRLGLRITRHDLDAVGKGDLRVGDDCGRWVLPVGQGVGVFVGMDRGVDPQDGPPYQLRAAYLTEKGWRQFRRPESSRFKHVYKMADLDRYFRAVERDDFTVQEPQPW